MMPMTTTRLFVSSTLSSPPVLHSGTIARKSFQGPFLPRSQAMLQLLTSSLCLIPWWHRIDKALRGGSWMNAMRFPILLVC